MRVLLIFGLSFTMHICFSQKTDFDKIKLEIKIDEFTGDTIRKTSPYPTWAAKGFSIEQHRTQFLSINGFCYMKFDIIRNSIHSIDEGGKIIFLMRDKSTYTINALNYEIAKPYLNYWNSEITYVNPLNINGCFNDFKPEFIEKYRVYYREGYLEYDVTDPKALGLQKSLNMLLGK